MFLQNVFWPPGWSLRCWSGLHGQDSPVGYCERSAHQRCSHHRPAVCGCGEEPGSLAQHGTATVQGLHSHRWGHQVGDNRKPPHMDHLFLSQCYILIVNCWSRIQSAVPVPRLNALPFWLWAKCVSVCACERVVLQILLRSPFSVFKNRK